MKFNQKCCLLVKKLTQKMALNWSCKNLEILVLNNIHSLNLKMQSMKLIWDKLLLIIQKECKLPHFEDNLKSVNRMQYKCKLLTIMLKILLRRKYFVKLLCRIYLNVSTVIYCGSVISSNDFLWFGWNLKKR